MVAKMVYHVVLLISRMLQITEMKLFVDYLLMQRQSLESHAELEEKKVVKM